MAKSGRNVKRNEERTSFLIRTGSLSLEDQFLIDILSSEDNSMSYRELTSISFRELNDYKTMLDILARSKTAYQIDNQPKESK